MEGEDYIGNKIRRGIPNLKTVETVALSVGLSVPVAVGYMLIAGLLTAPIGAIAAGTFATSALIFWLARGSRKGAQSALRHWDRWPVKPGNRVDKI